MFDDWAWSSYKRVLKEAREPTPFKSAAQKRYKRQRRKNDIYTTKGGHKNLGTGAPFSGKMKRAGTDRLRFESLQEILGEDIDFSELEPKEGLSPTLWEGELLREEIGDQLLQVAYDFLEYLDLEVDMKELLLVGSMAGYNYSRYSDIDLHIVLDFGAISVDKGLLERYFKLAKSKWNATRTLMLSGHDVEVYVEDTEDERIPSATYSVMKASWVTKPSREGLTIDYEGVTKKVSEKMGEIEALQELHDSGEDKEAYRFGTKLRSKIKNFRQAGLEGDGEYSNENLAFKVLKRSGALDRINDMVKACYLRMRSGLPE